MGPKKGRPKKNSTSDNPEESDPLQDAPIVAKASRGRPAKKKTVLASTSATDDPVPSIENVPNLRKTSRGRGRKRVKVTREVLCLSNSDMLLRSQIVSSSGDTENAAEESNNSQNASNGTGSASERQATNFFSDEESYPINHQSDDMNGKTEDKSNKENGFSPSDDSTKSPQQQKPEPNQTKDFQSSSSATQELNVHCPPQEEPSAPSMPFSPGDVPLKKRRLRDLVMRDQEGFLIPTPTTTFASPTSSSSSTPLMDSQPELPRRIIGAHVLYTDEFEHALYNAKSSEYQAVGMFLKDLKSWLASEDITPDDASNFQKAQKECGFCTSSIVARGSYIVELCSSKEDVRQASLMCVIDDLNRCSKLGLTHYTVHLSEMEDDDTSEDCILRVAEMINQMHRETSSVMTILQNTCGGENLICGSVDDLKEIFDLVEDKSRIGFALDTCHLYSSGIDITRRDIFEAFLQEFKDKINLRNLKVIYVNDSEGALNSHIDMHMSIGQGEIGLEFFDMLVNHPELCTVPMILETPIQHHKIDHQLLNSLIR